MSNWIMEKLDSRSLELQIISPSTDIASNNTSLINITNDK